MEIWKYKLANKYAAIEYIAEGKIYFKSNNQVFCLDTETGKEIWNFSHINMSFYLFQGKLILENHRTHFTVLHCLDIQTGKELWKKRVFSTLDLRIKNNKIYVHDDKDIIYCIDIESGEEIWKFSEEYFIKKSEEMSKDLILEGFRLFQNKIFIIAGYDIENSHLKYILSLDAFTGKETGKFSLEAGTFHNGVDVKDICNGKILVVINQECNTNDTIDFQAISNNDIVYYDEESGKEIWRFTDIVVTDPLLQDNVIADNERVYFTGKDYLYSLDLESGKEIWKYKTRSTCNLYVENKRIYAFNKSGVYCLGKEKGEEIWKIRSNLWDHYFSSEDKRVYISTEHYIYFLDGEGGEELRKFRLSFSSILKIINKKLYVKSGDYIYCLYTEINEKKKIEELDNYRLDENFHSINDVVKKIFKGIENLYHNNKFFRPGLTSGFFELDIITSGFQPGELIILAARPGMGKTTLALNIALANVVGENIPVAIFNLETSLAQIARRILSTQSMVDFKRLRRGFLTNEDWPKLTQTKSLLADKPLYIAETPSLSIEQLMEKTRQIVSRKGIKLVIIDYIQLILSDKNANRNEQFSEISRGLKIMAKELAIPVIALSQLSGAVEKRSNKRPLLSDLIDYGRIEQDVDMVLFLYREDYYNSEREKSNIAEIIIAKQRSGPPGDVKLMFWGDCLRFLNQ